MKRYEFSAVVGIDADSIDEARRVIDREMKEAQAPLSRRLRGDVREVKVEIAPKPIEARQLSDSAVAKAVDVAVGEALHDAAVERWRLVNVTDYADLGKRPTAEDLQWYEDAIRAEVSGHD